MFGIMVTVTNTSAKRFVTSCKIHYVEIWVPVPSIGGISSVNLNWSSDAAVGNSDTVYSDASINPNKPAHIYATPPFGSAQSMWFNETGDENIFEIVTDSACIIDVHASGIVADKQIATDTYVVSSATIGTFFHPPLDGVTDVLIPVGLQTAT
jgi:hypothetical protein